MNVLDPTSERSSATRLAAPRPAGLTGLTIGLLDIHKPRGDVFLDRLAVLCEARGLHVRRYAKPTFAKPAPTDLRQRLAEDCDVVVEALAD